MAQLKVSQKQPPIVQLNFFCCYWELYLSSSLRNKLLILWPLCLLVCVSAGSPHTYTRTSNKCRGLPSISVCVFLYLSSHGGRGGGSFLAITASSQSTWLQPPRFIPIWCRPAWYQSNYPVLAIYIPRHTVHRQLVTETPQWGKENFHGFMIERVGGKTVTCGSVMSHSAWLICSVLTECFIDLYCWSKSAVSNFSWIEDKV